MVGLLPGDDMMKGDIFGSVNITGECDKCGSEKLEIKKVATSSEDIAVKISCRGCKKELISWRVK